ncbi:hypothetical protein RF11_00761 [Thelohanellus kitauei]|uniref:Uncharacterized protein n=1 Tax=Thelohanellus kitauei TaxID=669202 RepID=A0A0C2M8L8_THEKT|nr:hypothetical protein RF11_00761 [Thelohanellus kitauei]
MCFCNRLPIVGVKISSSLVLKVIYVASFGSNNLDLATTVGIFIFLLLASNLYAFFYVALRAYSMLVKTHKYLLQYKLHISTREVCAGLYRSSAACVLARYRVAIMKDPNKSDFTHRTLVVLARMQPNRSKTIYQNSAVEWILKCIMICQSDLSLTAP